VARGYLNQPDLTRERFINDPFAAPLTNARLYRTGDMVRYLPDGNIEFLGRRDNQVKIRGYRIELGEIESWLCRHPAITEATVQAYSQPDGEQRIVAYVVIKPGSKPSTEELRVHLQQKLPDYMTPSAFITLNALPYTSNGKLDKSALPNPDESAHLLRNEYVAPRSRDEQRVAEIWEEVLGLERVGATDHFFDLGGHSLLVTQVIARTREEFRNSLPVRALFDAPTVERFAIEAANYIDENDWNGPITRRSEEAAPEEVTNRVESMSELEIDRMLERMLTGGKAV
jgi:acyl carrier protein